MATRKEVAWLLHDKVIAAPAVAHSELRPANPIQALMECPPGIDPLPSLEELAPLRELIDEALHNVLTDRERWVFEALYCRRVSQRKLAAELGMSRWNVMYIRDCAREKLCRALLDHVEIREYLGV